MEVASALFKLLLSPALLPVEEEVVLLLVLLLLAAWLPFFLAASWAAVLGGCSMLLSVDCCEMEESTAILNVGVDGTRPFVIWCSPIGASPRDFLLLDRLELLLALATWGVFTFSLAGLGVDSGLGVDWLELDFEKRFGFLQ